MKKHRFEIYKTLLGSFTVTFGNFEIGSYSRINSNDWRGKGIGIGILGRGIGLPRTT